MSEKGKRKIPKEIKEARSGFVYSTDISEYTKQKSGASKEETKNKIKKIILGSKYL